MIITNIIFFPEYDLTPNMCYTLLSTFVPLLWSFVYTWTLNQCFLSPPDVSYFKYCLQQPNIPNYLLGLVLISLLTHPFFTRAFQSRLHRPSRPPKCLLSLLGFTWLLAGIKASSKNALGCCSAEEKLSTADKNLFCQHDGDKCSLALSWDGSPRQG